MSAAAYADNYVYAETIRDAILSKERSDPRGISLVGLVIIGDLTLSSCKLNIPLSISGSHVLGKVELTDSRTMRLKLSDHRSPTVYHEPVSLSGAEIDGALFAASAQFRDGLSMISTSIHGLVSLFNADFSATTRNSALIADGLRVEGDTLLSEASMHASVSMRRSEIGGDLMLGGVSFDRPYAAAFIGDGMRVGGSLLAPDTTAAGSISIVGAKISGQLVLGDSVLVAPPEEGASVVADGVTVGSDFVADRLYSLGALRMPGAVIHGQLRLRSANLLGSPIAFLGDSMEVREIASFESTYAQDSFRLIGSEFKGQLDLQKFIQRGSSDSEEATMLLEGIRVSGGVFGEKVSATVSVSFARARISGALDLEHLNMHTDSSQPELNLRGMVLDGDLLLQTVSGAPSIGLSDARIHGSVTLAESAVDLVRADRLEVAGVLDLSTKKRFKASFEGASISRFHIRNNQKPVDLIAMESVFGWKIGAFSGPPFQNVRHVEQWLSSSSSPESSDGGQAWEEVARAFERGGRPADGRWLRYRSSVRSTRTASTSARAWRTAYRAICGSGHYPWMAVGWLIVVFVAAFAAASLSGPNFTTAATIGIRADLSSSSPTGEQSFIKPTVGRPKASQWNQNWEVSQFSATSYAASIAFPVTNLSVSDSWTPPRGPLSLYFSLLKAAAWILTALLLAGVAGVLRRVP
ncbi:MAG: hypothetical protein PIR53_10220 [Nocardioides alkalitolerans]